MSTSRVSVVVVTYGRQPLLVDCVNAICQSVGVTAEVVIVDNGHDGDEVSVIEGYDEVTVIRPGANTGFAGGCNLARIAQPRNSSSSSIPMQSWRPRPSRN